MAKRLFIALELPESCRKTLADLAAPIRGARWLAADQLHRHSRPAEKRRSPDAPPLAQKAPIRGARPRRSEKFRPGFQQARPGRLRLTVETRYDLKARRHSAA
jgi:hypothetical protein